MCSPIFQAFLISVVICTSLAAGQGAATSDSAPTRQDVPYAESDFIRVRGTWSLVTGETLQFKVLDRRVHVFVGDEDECVFKSEPYEAVSQVVLSQDRTKALLSVSLLLGKTKQVTEYNYSRLVVISRNASNKWVARSFLKAGDPPMDTARRFISKIERISDSGEFARVRMGVETPSDAPPYNYAYHSATIRLSDGAEVDEKNLDSSPTEGKGQK